MKYSVAILILALVVVASCQEEAVGGKWTKEQVLEKINSKLPAAEEGVCVGVRCKMSCVAEGHKAGYCAENTCTCIL
ncbi:hypothetical protein JTB14_035631 [Gonioctena quinquepunctata]|nr:hypothetical protein JTB14_035631 [Gonioctena quinquepunctata]